MCRMSTLHIRLLSLALFGVFCATAAWWMIALTSRAAVVPAAVVHSPLSTGDAATLFGGKLVRNENQDIQLFGILSLRHGAAAIVGVNDEPPHAVSLGAPLVQGAEDGKLAEVRARSVVIDRNGARTEVFLPAPAANGSASNSPTTYVR
jgi:general secretion pathway protein C